MHPALRSHGRLKPYPVAALVRASARPTARAAQPACRLRALSEVGAARLPPRRLARGRRHRRAPTSTSCREQHLDAYGIEYGILGPLGVTGQSELNLEFSRRHRRRPSTTGSASTFTQPEPRLKVRHRGALRGRGGLRRRDRALRRRSRLRAGAHADAHERAARQSPLLADLRGRRAARPAGRRCTCSAPAGIPTPAPAGPPTTSRKAPGIRRSCQTVVSSLVIEGVFERFPRLKVVLIEGGFAWLPSLMWRLDKLFERMRDEVPHLKPPPSEYIREHIWVTTQPMEEPDDRRHRARHHGVDRLGPAAVRHRLPALGLRRSVPRLPAAGPRAGARIAQILRGNGRAGIVPRSARDAGQPADMAAPRRRARGRHPAGRAQARGRSAGARSSSSTSTASSSRSPTSARTRAAASRAAS